MLCQKGDKISTVNRHICTLKPLFKKYYRGSQRIRIYSKPEPIEEREFLEANEMALI